MRDVQELFRLSTQDARPDPGFVDRQHDRRRRRERTRKAQALAVGLAIAAAVAAFVVRSVPGEPHPQPGGGGGTVASIEYPPVRLSRTAGGVRFSFVVRTWGWAAFEGVSINKSIEGPQNAEAILFWSSFPDGGRAEPCGPLLSASIGPSADDLATRVSAAPGTDLVEGPSDVTVGGREATFVELTVRENIGCGPGFFYDWHDRRVGPFWAGVTVGDTIRVWIMDVDGRRLFLEAVTNEDADSHLEHEIDRIVGSIRFD